VTVTYPLLQIGNDNPTKYFFENKVCFDTKLLDDPVTLEKERETILLGFNVHRLL